MYTQTTSFLLHCEDSIDGILTAIYEAFVLKKKMPVPYEDTISIAIGDNASFDLFSTWVEITTDTHKASLTISTIQKQLGNNIYMATLRSICHFAPDRATIVLGFLVRAFKTGPATLNMLSDSYVMRVLELSRKASNEAYRFLEVVRFKQIQNTLYSRIEPKCTVLPFICDHFQDRFQNENWVIYDAVHKIGSVHRARCDWILVSDPALDLDLETIERNDEFVHLWKVFFSTIGIKERENARCQNNLLAKWYRKNMDEFES